MSQRATSNKNFLIPLVLLCDTIDLSLVYSRQRSSTWFSNHYKTSSQCCSSQPQVRYTKHGYFVCLTVCINSEIIISSDDVESNPGPNNSQILSCFDQNVRSLKGACAVGHSYETKLQTLQDIAYGFDLEIICLTETWLNGSISHFEILASGNKMYRNSLKLRTGGGVLTAVKSTIKSNQLSLSGLPDDFEVVMVEIENSKPNRKILIMNCCRSPKDSNFRHCGSRLNKYIRGNVILTKWRFLNLT